MPVDLLIAVAGGFLLLSLWVALWHLGGWNGGETPAGDWRPVNAASYLAVGGARYAGAGKKE